MNNSRRVLYRVALACWVIFVLAALAYGVSGQQLGTGVLLVP